MISRVTEGEGGEAAKNDLVILSARSCGGRGVVVFVFILSLFY